MRRSVRSLTLLLCAVCCGCVAPVGLLDVVRSGIPSDDVAEAETPLSDDAAAAHFWVEDPTFDAAWAVLPAGLSGERSEFAWRWGGPDVGDGDRLTDSVMAARDGGPSDVELLRRTALNEALPHRTRAAAVEAWSLLLARGGGGEEAWRDFAAAMNAEPAVIVRAEFLRSIGRGVEPQRVPAVVEAFAEGGPPELRVAALDGCLLAVGRGVAAEGLPSGLAVCRYDPTPRVRRRYGRLVAMLRTADAYEVLTSQTRDVDPVVRDEACLSLGLLGGDAAVATLEEFAESAGERTRAAAVRGLAAAGRTGVGVNDGAASVRQAAAAAFAGDPGGRSAAALERLAGDADRAVQGEAVKAVAGWPDRLAVPVLLRAMEAATHRHREAAAEAVRRRTGTDLVFVSEASADRRAAAVARWRRELGYEDDVSTPAEDGRGPRDLVWAVYAAAGGGGPDAAWATLESLGEGDVPAVEAALKGFEDGGGVFAAGPRLWRVLGGLREDFAACERIADGTLAGRVEGAERLAEFCRRRSPSTLVVRRLPALLGDEQNGRVWRAVVAAAGEDAAVAEAVLPAALHSPWPDVRAAACGAVGRHGAGADLLRPLFTDADAAVRVAAAEAAGRSGHAGLLSGPEESPGLRSLRQDESRAVRAAAVVAMASLGDEAAVADLMRRAGGPDARDRRAAAAAIGASAHSPAVAERFDAILDLAWAERDHAAGLSYAAALDRIGGRVTTGDYEDRLRAWSGPAPRAGQTPQRSGASRTSPR